MTDAIDTTSDTTTGRERWEEATEAVLVVLAFAFLVSYAWPILRPDIRGTAAGRTCDVVGLVSWAAFAIDYVVRLTLSRRRWVFVRGHVVDLATVLLPVLRPLRLLRLVTALGVLNRRASSSLRGRVAVYVVGATVLIVFVASLAALDAERGRPGATIDSFGDALWWAMTTVTTVGYGDVYPITVTGRFVAAGLMLSGIALLGVVTASLATWLIDSVSDAQQQASSVTANDIAELKAEVERLRTALEQDSGTRS